MKLLKLILKQYLNKSISHLLFDRNILKSNDISDNLFPHIVVLNIDILSTRMKLRIFNKDYSILIIAVDDNSLYALSARVKLIKEFT